MELDSQAIAEFYAAAQRQRALGAASVEKARDGATVVAFEQGDCASRETAYGGEPCAGQVVVAQRGRPVWSAVYYAVIHDATREPQPLRDFLSSALQSPAPEFPLRGPALLRSGPLEYRCRWVGDFGSFSGTEVILEHGHEVYRNTFAGGFIARRAETV
jgi:hypothetical protein